MSPIHVSASDTCQRNTLGFSLTPQNERRRDALLRTAWMKIVAAFPCRPAPRSAWDHAADGSEARWEKVIHPMRMAVSAAVFIGNQQLIEQTMEGVRDFLRAVEADIASLIPATEEESVIALALLESEREGTARREKMALVAHPDSIEAERAIEPLLDEESALVRLINCVQRLARQPQMRAFQ